MAAPPDYVDAVTADELKVVEAERKNIIKIETARGPQYLTKIELRKETWEKVCKMLEAGQAENLRLLLALKEKLKVEKAYAAGLKSVGTSARPKGVTKFLPIDEMLGDQTEVSERLTQFNTYMENEVVKVLDNSAGEYLSQVDRIHKTGADLMHCFETANEMVTQAYDEFSKVTDAMAIQEQNQKEKEMAGGVVPDGEEGGPDDDKPHDLWLAEMKYRVATGYCLKSFQQYDETFTGLITELKDAETKRRTDVNSVIFDMIRKQEEIKYHVAETEGGGGPKAGPVKDERFTELKKKEDKVTKDAKEHLNAGMSQFDSFTADVDKGYPSVTIGGPLESKLLDKYILGAFKGVGMTAGFGLGLIMRTVDDHIHVFNVPKGMEEKTPEEIFESFIPAPPAIKDYKAASKKAGSKVAAAPTKAGAAGKFKATAALVSPNHTVFLSLSDCYKKGNTNGDVIIVQKTLPKKGKKAKTSTFTLRSVPADSTWATIKDEDMNTLLNKVYESEQEYKDATAAPPKA